jgi:hypothetical protein
LVVQLSVKAGLTVAGATVKLNREPVRVHRRTGSALLHAQPTVDDQDSGVGALPAMRVAGGDGVDDGKLVGPLGAIRQHRAQAEGATRRGDRRWYSERVKEAALRAAASDKEALARQLLAEHPVEQWLICAFRNVEPCVSFEYHCTADPSEQGMRLVPRRCLNVDQYLRPSIFGFRDARPQPWIPLNVQICLNGRE